ncbi:hypothetical protein MMC11_001375 [Xylographa trunciseda]|nr:hypothetical protein [Xylographa trunciseda]
MGLYHLAVIVSEIEDLEEGTNGLDDIDNFKKLDKKLTIGREEEFDQGRMKIELLLMLDPRKMYGAEDMDKPNTLVRALRLLYCVHHILHPEKVCGTEDIEELKTLVRTLRPLYGACFGITSEQARISAHMSHDKLSKNIENAVKKEIETIEAVDIARLRSLHANVTNEKTESSTSILGPICLLFRHCWKQLIHNGHAQNQDQR